MAVIKLATVVALGAPAFAGAASSSTAEPRALGGLLSNPGGWVIGQLDGLEDQATHGANILSSGASKAVGAVGHGLATVGNSTGHLAGSLADSGKRAAIGALLWSSGKCPSFTKHLPGLPQVLAPLLAHSFQADEKDPSISQDACARSVVASLGTYIDHLGNQTESDRMVLKWIGFDRSVKVCNDQLMESLRTMAPIRQSYPEQYEMAVADRLLLDVITEEALLDELSEFCGKESQQNVHVGNLRGTTGLYEEGNAREGPAASASFGYISGVFALMGALLTALPIGLRVATGSWSRGPLGHQLVPAPAPEEASNGVPVELPDEGSEADISAIE